MHKPAPVGVRARCRIAVGQEPIWPAPRRATSKLQRPDQTTAAVVDFEFAPVTRWSEVCVVCAECDDRCSRWYEKSGKGDVKSA